MTGLPWLRTLAVVIAGGLFLVGCGGSAPTPSPVSPDIRVLASWQGPEIEAFRTVVQPFERRTGYNVVLSTTRDLRGTLDRSIAAGDPPDLAGLPGPGYMLELARQGHLIDLGTVLDPGLYRTETAPGFVDIGTVDGKLRGVFMKATVKGLFWYDPQAFDPGYPQSWAELQLNAIREAGEARPWCIGLASGASSGWPGTDWIEDFVLRQSGPQVYDAWVEGHQRWTSPEIRSAFVMYGTVVDDADVAGGVDGALHTDFSRAGDGLFTEPPACLLAHQGSFMSTFLDEAVKRYGGRYDILPFPDIDPRYHGALIGAGDLFALTRDTPGGRDLIRYLIGREAQEKLVGLGGALSGNLNVRGYPDRLTTQEATILGDASIFRFDASDAMPDDMNEAFWQAVLDFTEDQSRLDEILEHLDRVQELAYRST